MEAHSCHQKHFEMLILSKHLELLATFFFRYYLHFFFFTAISKCKDTKSSQHFEIVSQHLEMLTKHFEIRNFKIRKSTFRDTNSKFR